MLINYNCLWQLGVGVGLGVSFQYQGTSIGIHSDKEFHARVARPRGTNNFIGSLEQTVGAVSTGCTTNSTSVCY